MRILRQRSGQFVEQTDLIAQFHDCAGAGMRRITGMAGNPLDFDVVIGAAFALGHDSPTRTGCIHDYCDIGLRRQFGDDLFCRGRTAFFFTVIVKNDFAKRIKITLFQRFYRINRLDDCRLVVADSRSVSDIFLIEAKWSFGRITWLEYRIDMRDQQQTKRPLAFQPGDQVGGPGIGPILDRRSQRL